VSTTTDFLIYPIAIIGVAGAISDCLRGRIYNWLTFPSMLLGLAYGAFFGGFSGFLGAFFGLIAGLALYGWMFWLRFMGAGDVKLLMALGAFGGLKFVVETALLGIMVGGVMALAMLLFSRRMPSFVKRMKGFFLSVVVKELEFEAPKIDRGYTMPYGPPIAVAAIWVAISSPFHAWGIW
jgi:prepilin peptidase CpaA